MNRICLNALWYIPKVSQCVLFINMKIWCTICQIINVLRYSVYKYISGSWLLAWDQNLKYFRDGVVVEWRTSRRYVYAASTSAHRGARLCIFLAACVQRIKHLYQPESCKIIYFCSIISNFLSTYLRSDCSSKLSGKQCRVFEDSNSNLISGEKLKKEKVNFRHRVCGEYTTKY